MLGRLSHTRLLRYAGLFTWAMVGVPLLYTALVPTQAPDGTQAPSMSWPGWIAYGLFGLLYFWLTRAMDGRRIRGFDSVLLLILTCSAIAISYYSFSGMGSILLMVVAGLLPWLLRVGGGVAWLVLSQFAVAPLFAVGLDFTWPEAIMQSTLYAGFCAFIFVTSLVARQQAQARDEQRRLNAELRATRALLAESARVNERTRISRELHDLLGHHLTALSLNLEVAGHLAQGKVQEHVGQAHTLAKLLLSDVREAVSQLRSGGAIDMAATLSPLAENVPGLDIRIAMPDPFLLDDAERAHVLLRCTQEIITNTVRHARARTLRLDYAVEPDAIRLRARDDGQGAELGEGRLGNGLRGLRERLASYGGRAEFRSAPGAGFALDIRLPLGEGLGVEEGTGAGGDAADAVGGRQRRAVEAADLSVPDPPSSDAARPGGPGGGSPAPRAARARRPSRPSAFSP